MEEACPLGDPWKVVMLAPIRRNSGFYRIRRPESLVPLEKGPSYRRCRPSMTGAIELHSSLILEGG